MRAIVYNILPEESMKIRKEVFVTEQGFVDAEYAYAIYIDRGYIEGLNITQAIPYYEKAAQKGHLQAIKGLALIYKLGAEGIAPDEEKYYFWMNKVLK